MLVLLVSTALAWPTASTSAVGVGCTVVGQDGEARHTHGGAEASVGYSSFKVNCTAATELLVDKVELLQGRSCELPPDKVASEQKVGGLYVDGMKESALKITIPAGTPTVVGVSFTPVRVYYTWCDRFAFRVGFRAGGEALTAVSELNVTREEPYRER